MSDIVLRRVTLLDVASVSATGNWYKCDYRYAPDQVRTVLGTMNASDAIFLEGTTDDADVTVSTIVTLETTSAATFAFNLFGPWSAIRIRKTGTNGAAVVKGII